MASFKKHKVAVKKHVQSLTKDAGKVVVKVEKQRQLTLITKSNAAKEHTDEPSVVSQLLQLKTAELLASLRAISRTSRVNKCTKYSCHVAKQTASLQLVLNVWQWTVL